MGGIGRFLSSYGYVFVEMFFLMSGVLFASNYIDKIAREEYAFGFFMVKRYMRLMPIVIITEFVCYCEQLLISCKNGIFFSCGTLSITSLFFDAFLGGGELLFAHKATLNGPAWYVGVLLVCYLLGYILTELSQKYASTCIYSIPIFVGITIIYEQVDFAIFNIDVARGLVGFFLGIFLHMFYRKSDKMRNVGKRTFFELSVLSLLIIVFVIRYDYFDVFTPELHLAFVFLFFPELFFILLHAKRLNGLLGNRCFRYLGKISYGIFLWNFPIYGFYFFLIYNGYVTLPNTRWGFVVLMVAVHVLIGVLSYEILEKPIKKRMDDRCHGAVRW